MAVQVLAVLFWLEQNLHIFNCASLLLALCWYNFVNLVIMVLCGALLMAVSRELLFLICRDLTVFLYIF